MKLYSAKISNEPLTSNVIGGTKVAGRIVVDPALVFAGFRFTSKVLPLSATRKGKIGEFRCERSERVHGGVTSYVPEEPVPAKDRCPRKAPGAPPTSVKISAE